MVLTIKLLLRASTFKSFRGCFGAVAFKVLPLLKFVLTMSTPKFFNNAGCHLCIGQHQPQLSPCLHDWSPVQHKVLLLLFCHEAF
eukprot:g54038.t1